MPDPFAGDGASRRPLVAGALFTASAGALTWLVVRLRKVRRQKPISSEVSVQDLLDPEKRANHIEWNCSLHESAKSIIPVTGANELYVAIGHQRVLELSQDHRLSSNPYSDERLIALNTMSEERHSAVSKTLHRFYQHREMRRLETEFFNTAEEFASIAMIGDRFDVMPWAKRVHMANTLKVLLGDFASSCLNLVDDLIDFNDDMVKLVAPLGGVGKPCPPFWSFNTLRVVRGLFAALPSTIHFLWKAGISGLRILRPDKTLARSDEGSGVWYYPELLPQVPRYFSLLLRLWDLVPARSTPSSPLEALKNAVGLGQVSLAEALVTIVQLMVNMTSANALGNLVMRFCTEKPPSNDTADLDAFVSEVLRLDAPLQRNPRRVLEDIVVDGVAMSAGASILLFIGAANVDPSFYESPACFIPNRKETTLTFGAGSHYCLGSYLVKAEMREALRFLLQFPGTFQLENSERVRNVDVGNYGFESLHLRIEKPKPSGFTS